MTSPFSDTFQPALWLDAADDSTLLLENGHVQCWNNKGTKSCSATQENPELQPLCVNQSVQFQSFHSLKLNLNWIGEGSHCCFVVLKNSTYSNLYGAAEGGKGYCSLHIGFENDTRYRMNIWGNDDYFPITQNFKHCDWNLLQFDWIIGQGKRVLANGSVEGTSTQWYKINNQFASGGRLVGVCTDTFQPMECEMREIIILTNRDITEENCIAVQSYLQSKWSL